MPSPAGRCSCGARAASSGECTECKKEKGQAAATTRPPASAAVAHLRDFSGVAARAPRAAVPDGGSFDAGSAIQLGTRRDQAEACLKRCEDDFKNCLAGNNPMQCLALRSSCQQACPRARACVKEEKILSSDTGVLVFDDKVFKETHVDIEWTNEGTGCDASCGEYRQFVKGHIFKNGERFDIGLCGGAKLEENVWHEDGEQPGGFCYGYRDSRDRNNDKFSNPDRANGTHYQGIDQPQVPGKAGDEIDVAMFFKSQTFDRCRDTFGQIHEWNFVFKGRLGNMVVP
jgi:hypothetical protein